MKRPSRPGVIGLFAGIGGLELGFERAGFRSILLCEIDPAAQAVLKTRYPKSKLVADVRDITDLPKAEVLCAGFPCQDLSSVGQKKGITGNRSSLIGEVFRLLAIRRVPWVVIENVPFMLQLNGGETIHEITRNLEKLGYKWAYRVIDTRAFGLPHRRNRVFLVASTSGDPAGVLFPSRSAMPPEEHDRSRLNGNAYGFYWTEGTYATGLAVDAIPPLKSGSTIGIPSPPAIVFPSGEVGTPDIRDAERLQGFPADWTKPAEEVVRASLRWRLVGNAVSVPVARWIAERIRARPRGKVKRVKIEAHVPWPPAACGEAGCRFVIPASAFPVSRRMRPISVFLRFRPRPLSEKATEGFVKRARAGNLRYPAGFLRVLERHASRVAAASKPGERA